MRAKLKQIMQNLQPEASALAKWEIQTRLPNGWHNCWIGEDGNPTQFESHEAADKELRTYLTECHLALVDGDILTHHDGDYRITVTAKPR